MVKVLHFHCRRHGSDPWSGNCDLTSLEFSKQINKYIVFKRLVDPSCMGLFLNYQFYSIDPNISAYASNIKSFFFNVSQVRLMQPNKKIRINIYINK